MEEQLEGLPFTKWGLCHCFVKIFHPYFSAQAVCDCLELDARDLGLSGQVWHGNEEALWQMAQVAVKWQ